MEHFNSQDRAFRIGIDFALPTAINKPNRISLLRASVGIDLVIEVLNDLYSNSWVTDTSKEEILIKIKYWEDVRKKLKEIKT